MIVRNPILNSRRNYPVYVRFFNLWLYNSVQNSWAWAPLPAAKFYLCVISVSVCLDAEYRVFGHLRKNLLNTWVWLQFFNPKQSQTCIFNICRIGKHKTWQRYVKSVVWNWHHNYQQNPMPLAGRMPHHNIGVLMTFTFAVYTQVMGFSCTQTQGIIFF